MKTQHKTVGIALAFADIYDNRGLGTLHLPVDGTVARFKKLTEVVPWDEHSLIVCTAGFHKNSPRHEHETRVKSLSGQLFQYVQYHHGSWMELVLCHPLCWSTRNEVRLGIKLAKREHVINGEPVHLVIASNLCHLFRVYLFAKLYTPKHWTFKLRRAKHYFSLWSHITECPKFVRDLLYVFKVSRRLRRIKALRA